MRFQVPQFIDVESKIFGPLTIKQFIYLAGGGGIIFLLYVSLPLFLTFLLGLPIGAFALALAFFKVNNQPFIKTIENALSYFSAPKLYLWKKSQPKAVSPREKKKEQPQIYVPKLTESKLKDLSWSLDIKEKTE